MSTCATVLKNMFARVAKIYNQAIGKYPLSFQCFQTGLLIGTGDAICQSIVEESSLFDFNSRRALEFFGLGAVIIGPPKVYWLKALSEHVTGNSAVSVVIRKVILDQAFFAPFGLVLFLVSLAIIQGKRSTEIEQILTEQYPKILLANYEVWPAVQVVNFYFIPLQYQVIFIQLVAIVWNIYLSYITHKQVKTEEISDNCKTSVGLNINRN